MLTSTPLIWFGYTLIIMYILGFIFCIFLRSVISETPLKRSSTKVRYGILFLIWMMSPAVVIGLFFLTMKVLTMKVIFRHGDKKN